MISKAVYKEIIDILSSRKFFLSDDFQININSSEVTILYKPMEQFYIQIKDNNKGTISDVLMKDNYSNPNPDMIVYINPGNFFSKEKTNCKNRDDIKNNIRSWLSNIEDELKVMPYYRNIIENRERIDELESYLEDKINNSNKEFTDIEKQDLINRLEKLEEELQQRAQSETELKKELDEAILDIQTLKEQIEIFDKKNWINNFFRRASNWVKNNPKLIGSALMQNFSGDTQLPLNLENILPLPEITETRECESDENLEEEKKRI